MADVTISYSENVSGWTSFWSYIPEWMVCLNSNFYTFNRGNLYRHNDVSVSRTMYYNNVVYGCSVQTIFNDDPATVKMFKTIDLDSNNSWNVSLTTDLQDGSISRDWFEIKEGEWYSFIRYNPENLTSNLNLNQIDASANYMRGMGLVATVASPIYTLTLSAVTPNFSTTYPYGSSVYTLNSGVLVYLGQLDFTTNSGEIHMIPGTITTPPIPGQYLVSISDPLAQSYGVRGYYLDITLTLPITETAETELFAVGTSVFKSYM